MITQHTTRQRSMDTLNYDTTHLIYEQLNAIDKLNTYQLFREYIPSQFEVSRELMKKQQIQGPRGLYMRATAEGEFEACVAAMLHVARYKQLIPDSDMRVYEEDLRYDWSDYDDFQRVLCLLYSTL